MSRAWSAKITCRPTSKLAWPHDHCTVLGYARQVFVIVSFRRVRRRPQRHLLDGVLEFDLRSGISLVTLYAIVALVSSLLADEVAMYLRFLDVLKHLGI